MKKIFARIAAPLKKNPGVVWTVIGVCLPPPTNVEEPFLHSAWPSAASRADHPHLRPPGASVSHSARRAGRRRSTHPPHLRPRSTHSRGRPVLTHEPPCIPTMPPAVTSRLLLPS